MVCRVQVSPQAEPERCTVRLAGRLTAVQLNGRLRVYTRRRLPSMSPIVFRPTPRWFPRLAASGAELVGVADYLGHTTEPM